MPQRPSIPIRSNNTPQSPLTPHNNWHSFTQRNKDSRQNKSISFNKTYKTHTQAPPTDILELQLHMLHELQLARHLEASWTDNTKLLKGRAVRHPHLTEETQTNSLHHNRLHIIPYKHTPYKHQHTKPKIYMQQFSPRRKLKKNTWIQHTQARLQTIFIHLHTQYMHQNCLQKGHNPIQSQHSSIRQQQNTTVHSTTTIGLQTTEDRLQNYKCSWPSGRETNHQIAVEPLHNVIGRWHKTTQHTSNVPSSVYARRIFLT